MFYETWSTQRSSSTNKTKTFVYVFFFIRFSRVSWAGFHSLVTNVLFVQLEDVEGVLMRIELDPPPCILGIFCLNFHGILSETHKGLKRVTLICLLCPMLVIIHFTKYHIWNEKKR